MHTEAYAAMQRLIAGLPVKGAKVLEIGSYNVNGSVRPLIEALKPAHYVGLDVREGPGVDEVGDGATWSGGKAAEAKPPFDLIVTAETLEHVKDPAAVIENAARLLRPGGWLVLTAAGPGRPPHSSDGLPKIPRGEHYANIDPVDLQAWLADGGWEQVLIQANPNVGDVYARARRPETEPEAEPAGDEPAAPEPAAEAETKPARSTARA